MPITKPEQSIDINGFENILKCKMHAYLAYGEIEEDKIPLYADDLEDLYSGGSAIFVALGDLAKDPIEYGFSFSEDEVHAGKKRGLLTVNGNVKSIAFTDEMLQLLDEPEQVGPCTLLFVPFKNPAAADVDDDNPAFAVLVSNVSLIPDGKGNGNNKYGEVNLKFNGEPNKIRDSIKLLTIKAATAPVGP